MDPKNDNNFSEVPVNPANEVETNIKTAIVNPLPQVDAKGNKRLKKISMIIGIILLILILTFSVTFSLAKGNLLSYIGVLVPVENIPLLKQLSPPPIQTLYYSLINKDSYKLDSDFTNKVTIKLKNIPELGDEDLQLQFTNDFDNDSKINTGVINLSTDYIIPEIGDAKDLQLDWNAEMSKGNYYFKFNDKLLDVLSNTLETFKQSSNNEIEEINYIQSLKGELMEKSLLVSTEPMQEYFDNLANSWTGLMDGIGASPNSVDTNSLSKEDQKAIQDKAFQIYDKYNFDEEVFILLKSLNFEYLNRENYNDKKAILVSVKFDDKSLLDGVKKANNNFAEKISHNKKSFVNDVCDYGILVAKAINNNSENDNNTQLEDCIKEYTANLDIYLDEMNDPIIKADRDKEMDKLVENKSFNVSLTFYIDAFNGMILGTKTILNSFESDYNFVIEHEFNRKSTKTEPILEKVLDIKDIIKKLDEIRNVNKQDEIKKITKALIVCPNLLVQFISNATIDSFGDSVDITFDTIG